MVSSNLPTDWSEPTIVDVAEKILDFRGRTPKKLGMSWGDGSIPAISARNVRMGHLDFGEEFYLGSEALYRRWMTRGDMDLGDVLITTEAPLGNVAAVPDRRRYILSQRVVLIRPKREQVDKTYLLKVLQAPAFQALLVENATGSTALGIQRRRLEKLTVPVPPLPEQRRIASALESVDNLIDSLGRLITKKQAIKQGMMQELLTGRKRLPGFDGPWKDVSLGTIATVTMGQSPAGATYNSDSHGIPLVQGNADIRDRVTFDRVWTTAPTKMCERGDIILTVRAPVGYTAIASRASCLGRGVCALSTKADSRFLFHALVYVEPSWAVYEQGSTFTAVNSNEVRSFRLRWPSDGDERSAIAHVLDDTDDELCILEARLEKARAIKQGMMQELLTGRARLPVPEAVA